MKCPEKENPRGWFERHLPAAAMAAVPIARATVASGHHRPIPLSELLWALGAIVVWASVIGAYFALAHARRRRLARERIQSVQITRYVDLTRKPSGSPPEADSER
ncbi:MAG: hypothetical protein ACYDC3_01360 [Candidatus Binataceae bacterium]